MANQLTECVAKRVVRRANRGERGVALFFAIFALLLLSAIAATLILSSATDSAIDGNYRSEEVAYYGAKSGVEEMRDRMMASNPNGSIPKNFPALLPTTPASPQLYLLNEGNQAGTVQPWTAANAYVDDELCHDGYPYAGIASVNPGLRCTTLPTAPGWYNTITSTAPWNTTAAALPYKWVRLGLKLDGSEQQYITDNTAANAGDLVCWTGSTEKVLPAAQPQNVASCTTAFASPANPVYLVTGLGVAPNGARKVVQAEIALSPTPPFPYGMFATSPACPAISFSGNPPSTDSYTTAGGQTYATTKSNTGGDIGSNGGVDIGNGNVGGIVGVLPAGTGPCATPFKAGPNGTDVGPNCPGASCVPNSATYLTQPYVFPVPPAPSPLPPNTNYNPPSCGGKGKVGSCMVPGTYGNISLTGALTLAPGTYNINSLSETGQGTITVSPPGAVILNIGGCGDATCSSANALANPLNIAGQGAVQIADDGIPNDFLINYAGSGTISIAGKGDATAMLNAPYAAITQQGNSQWYGSILGGTISLGGNAFFHFDRASALSPNSNSYYTMISYRELSY